MGEGSTCCDYRGFANDFTENNHHYKLLIHQCCFTPRKQNNLYYVLLSSFVRVIFDFFFCFLIFEYHSYKSRDTFKITLTNSIFNSTGGLNFTETRTIKVITHKPYKEPFVALLYGVFLVNNSKSIHLTVTLLNKFWDQIFLIPNRTNNNNL